MGRGFESKKGGSAVALCNRVKNSRCLRGKKWYGTVYRKASGRFQAVITFNKENGRK
jgi:hypothetical protein